MLRIIRKYLGCKFGMHYRVIREGNDICAKGICSDCGEEFKAMSWPMPKVKHVKDLL